MTGGGTGGHVSPITAVASEIKRHLPDADIHFVGQRGDRFSKLLDDSEQIDSSHRVFAGKWRRYHGIPMWKQLLDLPTLLLNIRDVLLVLVGLIESVYLMLRYRPDVVFVKGGFVGIPVGIAAAITRRKIVTHDSDAIPGLTNRVVGRWANVNATGMPPSYYPYPKNKIVQVGVPFSANYKKITEASQAKFKSELELSDRLMVLVTGGSLGAGRINDAVIAIAPELIKLANVVHVCGQDNFESVAQDLTSRGVDVEVGEGYRLLPFVKDDLYKYSGAADVVIARTGANSTAELAAQGKAVVMVPNPRLTGGHQLKNAQVMLDANAAVIVDESELVRNPELLLEQVRQLLDDKNKRQTLGEALHKFALPNASAELATVLIEAAANTEHSHRG